MPDEFEAKAIARRVREDLEHQLFKAQERLPQAEGAGKRLPFARS